MDMFLKYGLTIKVVQILNFIKDAPENRFYIMYFYVNVRSVFYA